MLPFTTILDNQYASMFYHPAKKMIHHRFYTLPDKAQLRHVLTCGLDVITRYGAAKWMSYDRDIGVYTLVDPEWINTDWLPRATAAGLKYWAMVVPQDVAACSLMTEFVNSFCVGGLQMKIFTDLWSPMQWLDTLKG